MRQDTVLNVKFLKISFKTDFGEKTVVSDVNFSVKKGETVALVGESGSGKSVTALSILGLNDNVRISGEIDFLGQNLLKLSEQEFRVVRGNKIAMIFQDPMTALNPFLKIIDQVMEPLIEHKRMTKYDARTRAVELLKMVGIRDVEKSLQHYPHHFSGGMLQRVMIAIALTCEPEVLIADEPTTALDVTIQAQILRLIQDLKQKLQMSIILITHNLGIVAGIADRVVVMKSGCVVEQGSVDDIFYNTQHPYTRGLIRSIPRLDQDKNERLYSMHVSEKDDTENTSSRKSVCGGFFRRAWSRVFKNKLFILGFCVLSLYLFIISFANFLPIYSYIEQHSIHRNLKPSFREAGVLIYEREKRLLNDRAERENHRALTPEEQSELRDFATEIEKDSVYRRHYIFGTDSLGRDMFSRLVHASRISILVGIVGAVVSVVIGVLVGSVSGYIGGRFDRCVMTAMEVLYSLPYMLLVIILMTILGDNIFNIFIAIAFVSWLVGARLVRGQILSLKNSQFIEAARSMGAGTATIIFKHLVPNILEIVIVFATIRVPSFILAETFLSFLGLGISAPLTSWGILIHDGVKTMELYSWQLFFPAIVMAMFLFSVNFIGDGLRDCFDLKEKTQGSSL